MTKTIFHCNHCGKTIKTIRLNKKTPSCCGVPMTKIQTNEDTSKSTVKPDFYCNSPDEMGGCCASEDC